MKHAAKSKVNWTQMVVFGIGIAITAGWIPEQYEDDLVGIALLAMPPIVIALRSHFTEHPLRWR